jgi:RNA polymerase sigma factor (sigma-70 family)
LAITNRIFALLFIYSDVGCRIHGKGGEPGVTMSAPTPFRIDLDQLGLDDLGLLVRHPRAPDSVRRAFVRALDAWTRRRVRSLTRSMRAVGAHDREDLVQEFLLRCLTRHLRHWQPATSTITGFLYPRLRGVVIDHWRRSRTAERHVVTDDDRDADLDVPVEDAVDVAAGALCAAQARDVCHEAVDSAVASLPARQRRVVRALLRGAALADVAEELDVHPSTVSRERAAAFTSLRTTLAPVADAWARVAAAA